MTELDGGKKLITASELPRRRSFYRHLDHVLVPLRLRYVPQECTAEAIYEMLPGPEGDLEQIWRTIYEKAVALIIHDDTLNYQKLNNLIVLNAGLVTGFGWTVQQQRHELALLFCLAGMVFSLMFDYTLQEGMRCLRSHKAKIDAFDMRINNKNKVLFNSNPWNHRDALEIGPLCFFALWLGGFIFQLYALAPPPWGKGVVLLATASLLGAMGWHVWRSLPRAKAAKPIAAP